jgi:hypothetical protein
MIEGKHIGSGIIASRLTIEYTDYFENKEEVEYYKEPSDTVVKQDKFVN